MSSRAIASEPIPGLASPHTLTIERGEPLPLGLHECCDGVNLAVFSRHAARMTLLLFDDAQAPAPCAEIDLDPLHHRTGDIWHVRLASGLWHKAYALRADGPDAPEDGHRFTADRLLADPYAPALALRAVQSPESAARAEPRAVIVDQRFDWQDTARPRRRWSETVIYETHVRGLTFHPSSGARNRGQYLGVIEKIPYLSALGVTAVELMPVQAFHPASIERSNPLTGERLRDYWGYNPIALFAPASVYASGAAADAALVEFKTMVRELHKVGLEVILDVVFNHTAEGDEHGPTYSFRGLDNAIYYMLAPDKRRYADFTGCSNTLNCNHPIVRSLVIDCLRHWVMHFHIDGFRFDLASVLGRDAAGNLLTNPPLLEQIAEDPILRDVKLIAEAWDSGGAFQVGSFAGTRWAEWNCPFRCDVRRFWRGDPGFSGRFASALCGSAALYERSGKSPLNSVNFVTSHDGFTLNDLVSYAVKHNAANGEENRDGSDVNYSENNGAEGPSDDPAIDAARRRQIRNLLTTLFLSRGVPMLLGGDEFRRTQGGNNNAYCQDNEVSWCDWGLAERNADLIRFVQRLIAFRCAHPALTAERFYTADEIAWLGAEGLPADWDGSANRLGCFIREGDSALCMLFNATRQPCRFALPTPPAGAWHVAIDTSRDAPEDAPSPGLEPTLEGVLDASLAPRSTMVLVCRRNAPQDD